MIDGGWISEVLRRDGQLLSVRAGVHDLTGASQDSRRIRRGELFVPLTGENTDGHRFLASALDAGAAGALVSDPERLEATIASHPDAWLWRVRDPLSALQSVARAWRREIDPEVIAITGSNGKTSTKELCAALLATLGPCWASEGNHNNLIGLPMTILRMPPDTRYAVLEMGCSGFGEIAELCELFTPRLGVVTNVAEAHLEELGDLEGVARAKGELPAALPADGLCFLRASEPYRGILTAHCGDLAVKSFGLSPDADFAVEDLGLASPSTRRARVGGVRFDFPRPARHQLLSLAAAWAVAASLGGDPDKLALAASRSSMSDNRGRLFKLGPYAFIDDSYNANPASLRAALAWLAESPTSGRRWALLGDMLELGDQEIDLHAACGREAAGYAIHGLMGLGPLSRHLVAAARDAGLAEAHHCSDHETLTAKLLTLLAPGDLVLVKGSRGMAMEKVLELLETRLGQEREVMT